MFEEANYFAPVVAGDDGGLRVVLGKDHPGFADAGYRQRRDTLATLAADWTAGSPVPTAQYTDAEHQVWRAVNDKLDGLHETYACKEFLDGKEALALPKDRIPQLSDVTAMLTPLTGFTYKPASGLVELREFYGSLADREFWSTQYIRHSSVPLYTPEPDVLHEVTGHGNTLAHDGYAALYEAAGRAARRVESQAALQFVSKVFWFTLEFGVLRENDEIRAYGAGILSSPGETSEFRNFTTRELNIAAMGTTDYDITVYQDVLFVADSFTHVLDLVGTFFDSCDDDSISALSMAPA